MVAFLALSLFGVLSYRATSDAFEMTAWVDRTNQVITQIHRVASKIEASSLHQREYLLTGRTESRNAALASFKEDETELARLAELTNDNPEQKARVDLLQIHLSDKVKILRRGIELKDTRPLAEVIDFLQTSQGPTKARLIRDAILEIEKSETTLLANRSLLAKANAERTRSLALIGTALAFFLLVAGTLLLNREFYRRSVAVQAAREAESIARKALNARSMFLASMSHEIRTPLHSIVGMADVLSDGIDEFERLKCVTIIRRASNLLMNLINDILDFSKIEAGRLELEHLPFELSVLLENTITIISFRASQKGLKLSYSIDPDASTQLVGDPNRIRQILLNLLGNAIKFTHQGQVSLDVSTVTHAETGTVTVRLMVSDTGIGIPLEKQPLVFEQFNQLHPSTSRSYGGTGLGLTISRQLVEVMKGKIWFESKVGVGTAFFVEIPLTPQTAPQTRVVAAETIRDQRALRILVVDDIEDNRLLMQLYLKHTPYRLDFAQNGEEALQKWKASSFDLVLMDMHMPKVSGLEAVERIRAAELEHGLAPIPILALTAYALKEDASRSVAAGCNRHLTKPITRDSLLKAIADITQQIPAGLAAGDAQQEIVYVERHLEPLLKGFMDNRRKELEQLDAAISARDYVTLESLAHSIKGIAGSFGFRRLSELHRDLQRATELRDDAKILSLVQETRHLVENARVVLI